MRHLSAERLAAVADEHPTPDEAAHLAQCGQCADGRDAHRRLIAGAALERDKKVAPLSSWSAISAQLRAEGVVRTPEATTTTSASDAVPVLAFSRSTADLTTKVTPVAGPTTPQGETNVLPMRRRVMPVWAMRAAAALVLVTGGVLAGRMSAPPPRLAAADSTPSLDSGPKAGTGLVAPVSLENSQVAKTAEFFQSPEDARRAMLQAETTYRAAMAYLALNDSTIRPPIADPVATYQRQLAALDSAVAATRKALKVAPTDPVINSYYQTSISAREATLRQIDDALPVNERVTRF